MKPRLCLVLFAFFRLWISAAWGLAPATSGKRNEDEEKTSVYNIVGSGRVEYLPASYVHTFPRWQLEGELVSMPATKEECLVERKSTTTISVQPTLNFLLKGGVPTYLMAGLWVDDHDQISVETNHLAQQWTTFAQSADPNFHVEVFMGPGDGTDQRLGVVNAQHMTQAVEKLGLALSTTQNENLADGFHIVTILLQMDKMEDLDMARGKGGTMMLACLATSEPDALQILALDNSTAEKLAMSKLEMEAFKVLSTV